MVLWCTLSTSPVSRSAPLTWIFYQVLSSPMLTFDASRLSVPDAHFRHIKAPCTQRSLSTHQGSLYPTPTFDASRFPVPDAHFRRINSPLLLLFFCTKLRRWFESCLTMTFTVQLKYILFFINVTSNIYTCCTFIEEKAVASVLVARDDEVASWVRAGKAIGGCRGVT